MTENNNGSVNELAVLFRYLNVNGFEKTLRRNAENALASLVADPKNNQGLLC